MTRRQQEQGFTIVELLIVVVLVSLVIGGALTLATSTIRAMRGQQEAMAVQGSARASLEIIAAATRNMSAGVPTGNVTDLVGCTMLSPIEVINSTTSSDEMTVIGAHNSFPTGLATELNTATASSAQTIMVTDGQNLLPGDLILITDQTKGHVFKVNTVTAVTGGTELGLAGSSCAAVNPTTYTRGTIVLRAFIARFFIADINGGAQKVLYMDPDGAGPAQAEPLALDVHKMQIALAYDLNGDKTITDTQSASDEWFYNDPGDGLPPITPPRAVRISLAGRSSQEVRFGQTEPPFEDYVSSAPEKYRWRVLSSTIEIRNLEGSE